VTTQARTGLAPAMPDGVAPARDRLTSMLFLAGLFHAILIIGITFDLADPYRAQPVQTIEVLLLGGRQDTDPGNEDAQYLAERSQAGSGTTAERVRPASPQSSRLPVPIEGTPEGTGAEWRDPSQAAETAEVIKSRSQERSLAIRSGVDTPADASEVPMALDAAMPMQFATNTADERLALRGDEVRELVVAADTRKSVVAPYLDAWKRKTESVGTLNYPQAARHRGMTGNPVVEVAIRADGSLADIRIVRSSGHGEIDRAALEILRLAAPFDPFPTEVRTQYDVLRFAYEWQFLGADGAAALRMHAGDR
jgi:protein TonB